MRRLVVLADGEQAIEALVTRGRRNGHNRHGSAPRFTVAGAVSGRLDAAGYEKPSAKHSGKCSSA